jgi:integrase
MAYIKQRPNGTYQAQVQHMDKRISKVFKTKGEAKFWAAKALLDLKTATQDGIDFSQTFEGVSRRYIKEVSSKKKGFRWEEIRLKAIAEHEQFKGVKFAKIDESVMSKWRDQRLSEVMASTVNRELNLLSGVFTKAIREWKIIKENPCKLIDKPRNPPSREKLISDAEIEAFLAAIPYNPKKPANTLSERVAVAFLFAIETAMRCGELCSLTAESIDGNVARLMITKNGDRRDVPLSKEAIRLLGLLPKADGHLFGLKSSQVDTTFRAIKSGIKGADYTFHDTRHLAITRLSRKVDAMSLARLAGHKNLSMTLKYFNPDVKDLAKLLD